MRAGASFFILLFILTLNAPQSGATTEKRSRFAGSQLSFRLQESDGRSVSCRHHLLNHVPWWRVICGEREFTVDSWLEQAQHRRDDRQKITLMFHASEGTASSGERLVQFQSHFSTFVLSGNSAVQAISSSLDVRNGLASLELTVRLDRKTQSPE